MIFSRRNLVKLHFILLPFGSFYIGSPYLGFSMVTSILICLFSISKITNIKINKKDLNLVLYLFLFWLFFVIYSLYNYRKDVITPNSELRMLTLYLLTFLVLFEYFQFRSLELINNFKLFSYSVFFICICGILGFQVETEGVSNRVTIFGLNSNFIAFNVVFSMSFFINQLLFNRSKLFFIIHILIIVSEFIVFLKLGSMTALACLAVSLLLIVLMRSKNIIVFIVSGVFSLLAAIIIYFIVINSEVYSTRIYDEDNLENLNGRKHLWELAYEQIELNPIFGIGKYEATYLINSVTGMELSFHNVYLEIVVIGGFFSLFLFILYLIFYFKSILYIENINVKPLAISAFMISVISIASGQFSYLFFTFPLFVLLRHLPEDYKFG